MLTGTPRTQRSCSSIQLPPEYSSEASSAPHYLYSTNDFIIDLNENCENPNKLKTLLSQRWEAAKGSNAFNYSLNCMYRCLEGEFDLTLQLNTERGELRRKPMHFKNIKEPFHPHRFNFTKLHDKEMLFYLKCEDDPITTDPLDRHLVAVNASPLERDHCLIIPAVNKCLPQVLTYEAVRIGIDLMLLINDDSFHILFNSLLGQASVNHLHLHGLYWPYDSDLINRKCENLYDVPDVFIIRPPNWICSAFVFQLTSRGNYSDFKSNIHKCVKFLTEKNQAHNVFFSRAQPVRTDGPDKLEDRRKKKPQYLTAYIFPRTNMIGAKPPSNFNPAANELAGNLTAYTLRFFESASEKGVIRIIEEEASLDGKLFENLCCELADTLKNRPIGTSRSNDNPIENDLTKPEIDELRDSFQSFMSTKPKM